MYSGSLDPLLYCSSRVVFVETTGPWYFAVMDIHDTQSSTSLVVDLTGLPGLVVQQVHQLVKQARLIQATQSANYSSSEKRNQGVIGMFAHLGVQTPTLEEFDDARRETWANFPREFPDSSK